MWEAECKLQDTQKEIARMRAAHAREQEIFAAKEIEMQENEKELKTLNHELHNDREKLHTECQNWEFKARRQESAPQEEQSDQEYPNDHAGEYDGYDEEDWQEGEEEVYAKDEADVYISAADEEFCASEAASQVEKMQKETEK